MVRTADRVEMDVAPRPGRLTTADIKAVVEKLDASPDAVDLGTYSPEDAARDREHAEYHVGVERRARKLLRKWSKRLWIPSNWNIILEIFCHTAENDGRLGSCNWGYLPNCQFVITLRCDLSPDELEWVLVHELLEAMLAPYGDFALGLFIESDNEPMRDWLDSHHRRVRDSLIEQLLHAFFGAHSPARTHDIL